MNLGDYIREYRQDHKLSLRQFSKLTGISVGYMSQLETGRRADTGQPAVPTIKILRQLAAGMGISLTTLVRSIDDTPVKMIYDADTGDELDEEIIEIREALRNNPDMRMLFSLTKNASAKEIKQAVAMMQVLRGMNSDE